MCTSQELQISWNAQGPVGPQGPEGPQGPAGLGAKVVTGGTFGDGNIYNSNPAFTLTRNGPGNYTITFTPGFWAGGDYPSVSLQPFFGGPYPSIPFASGNAEIWIIDFGGVDTTFNFTFIQD